MTRYRIHDTDGHSRRSANEFRQFQHGGIESLTLALAKVSKGYLAGPALGTYFIPDKSIALLSTDVLETYELTDELPVVTSVNLGKGYASLGNPSVIDTARGRAFFVTYTSSSPNLLVQVTYPELVWVGEWEVTLTNFGTPLMLCLDSVGDVWCVPQSSNPIAILNPDTGELRTFPFPSTIYNSGSYQGFTDKYDTLWLPPRQANNTQLQYQRFYRINKLGTVLNDIERPGFVIEWLIPYDEDTMVVGTHSSIERWTIPVPGEAPVLIDSIARTIPNYVGFRSDADGNIWWTDYNVGTFVAINNGGSLDTWSVASLPPPSTNQPFYLGRRSDGGIRMSRRALQWDLSVNGSSIQSVELTAATYWPYIDDHQFNSDLHVIAGVTAQARPVPGPAQYGVRILRDVDQSHWALYEIEVFVNGVQLDNTNMTVAASAYWDGYPPENLIDRDMGTNWTKHSTDAYPWIDLKFDAPQDGAVTVRIYPFGGLGSTYDDRELKLSPLDASYAPRDDLAQRFPALLETLHAESYTLNVPQLT